MLVVHVMSLFTKLLLDASFMYATQGWIFSLQWARSADLCIAQGLSIGRLSRGSFATCVAPYFLACFIPRGDHCGQIYMLFQSRIGLAISTRGCPRVVSVSCLAVHAYHGWARSNLPWPLLVVRLSTGQSSQLRLSVYGSNALWLIWVLDKTLPTLSTLTVKAH